MPKDTIDQELQKKREAHSSKWVNSINSNDVHFGKNINSYHLLNRAREEKVFLEVRI